MQMFSPSARQLSGDFSYTELYANHTVQFHQIMLKPKVYKRSNLMNFSKMQIHDRLKHGFSSGIKLNWVGQLILIVDLSALALMSVEASECNQLFASSSVAFFFSGTNSELAPLMLRWTQIWQPHHWYTQLITFRWLLKEPTSLPILESPIIAVACLKSLSITALEFYNPTGNSRKCILNINSPLFCRILWRNASF